MNETPSCSSAILIDRNLAERLAKFIGSPRSLSRPMCVAAILAGGCALQAHASDGPAMTGLAASADDAVTAVTNPAGLARLHRTEWVAGIQAFYAGSDFTTTAQSTGGFSSDSGSTAVAI